MRLQNYTILAALLLFVADGRAQTAPAIDGCTTRIDLSSSMLSDSRRALERTLMLTTAPEHSYLFRTGSMRQQTCAPYPFLTRWQPAAPHGRFDVLPVELSVTNQSAYPRSVNDGGAWQGVGLNLAAAAGVRASWSFLTVSLAPEVYYQQNKEFRFIERSTVQGRSPLGNPYHAEIDLPSRMGTTSFETLSLGQSYVQANYKNVSATFGNENVWIGAAEVYPIVMSYTAPGFPHIRLGTQKPLDLRWINLEFQILMASLKESDYFDINPDNDDHYYTVTAINIEPKFAPGLYLGIARAYHDTASALGQGPGFYASRLFEGPFGAGGSGNRVGNSLAALYGRWVHPASGFEAYVEWSREDTPGGFMDLLREPDWTQAYVLGFQKAFASPGRVTRLYGEAVHLGESAPVRAGRGSFSYYTHSIVRQGHTHRGQLLGAAIGPGSDAQLMGVDVFTASSRSALRVERTRYDDDTYYRTFARRFGETRHDTELTFSASRLQFLGAFEVEAELGVSRRYGRQFMPQNQQPALIESNLAAGLRAAWRPNW
jgi:hypothetical protein